ncbi:cupin domain-containing protein [Streptomyces sp. ME01-24h]|nr:cupin domain-containing protein [Streptomyces sp. ME19-03-3]MDX3237470.1 cupin domain-containing protein [Streptomyces sp. ME03-5709C]MDX3353973.1 cupin domain-containing protein [Streptomyces sp. ME01-24h]
MEAKPGSESKMQKFDICVKGIPPLPEGTHGMVQVVELPPGDPGPEPHRHSGPLFGYMLEGEMLFELEGGKPYAIKAGEGFWEPADVVHYRASNLRDDITSRFVVFMLCAPGVPMTTFLDASEIAERSQFRYPNVEIEEYSRRMPPVPSS